MPAPPKLDITDQAMIDVIQALKDAGHIRFTQDFLTEVEMAKQHFTNVKKGTKHFSAKKIRLAKKAYPMINLNYLFGSEKNALLK